MTASAVNRCGLSYTRNAYERTGQKTSPLRTGCPPVDVSLEATLPPADCQWHPIESKSYPVLSGVGLALQAKDGRLYVGKVVPKSPADQSGLIPEGVRLVAIEVNGKETLLDGKTVGEAASLIHGPVGTELVLTVVPSKDGTAIKVRLIRAPLEIAGVSATTYKAFIGKAMPKLKLTSLDGRRSSQLADYRGKVVVLDIWASWCPM